MRRGGGLAASMVTIFMEKNMYRESYAFAGMSVEIITRYEYAHHRCEQYRCVVPAVFSVYPTLENIISTREGLVNMGNDICVFSDEFLEFNALLGLLGEELLAWSTLLFHASAVAMDGKAYLFTAKSGTGKSTHAQYWKECFGERVKIINDDTPFLRIQDGEVTAYGSPWCGKHRRNVNMSAPVEAICLIEQSEKNYIEPLSVREAFPILYRQTRQVKDCLGRQKELALLDMLSKSVRLYRLGVNMSMEAAMVAYEGMNGGAKP